MGASLACVVRGMALAIAVVVAGCADEGLVVCGNGWACPLGFVCDLAHRGCVLPGQLEACDGMPDGMACSYTGAEAGTCIDGVCFPAECGNGIVDPGEACDDGNRVNSDGCSGDCLVVERCGDGTIQTVLGEQCDDASLANHDGCDSACRNEQPDWRPAIGTPPSYRVFAAIAHDGFRQRTVMFSGQESSLARDTVEWDGAAWIVRSNVTGPSPRLSAAIAFDSARGEIVLVGGGINGSTPGADTWIYDGVSWTRRTPSVSPPARFGATMAYDDRRHRAVLFGGYDGSVAVGDTWEWDGTTWKLAAASSGAAPRNLPVSCFDPRSGAILLIGGVFANGQPAGNALWAWDGTTWTRRMPATTTPDGTAVTMAPDPSRGVVVLITRESQGMTEWEWNGSDWTRTTASLPVLDVNGSTLFFDLGTRRLGLLGLDIAMHKIVMMYRSATSWDPVPPTVEPPARNDAAMAYDPLARAGVMFGGLSPATSAPLGDLWAWRRSHWVELQPASGPAPTPRHGHAMAYDAARAEIVVVGGRTVSQRTGETWAWNGSTWRLAGMLPAREHLAIAYDPRRARIVAFGGIGVGFDGFDHALSETWEWDGSSWIQVPASGPSGRSRHTLAYDARRGKIVMFGGRDDYETFDDVWEYDGTTWMPRTTSLTPPPRSGHAMVYNAARGTTVVMGGRSPLLEGSQPLGDTWEWNGTAWTPIATFRAPPARGEHAATYDEETAHVIMFGGGGSDETWSYGYDGSVPDETCGGGHDADRDGRVGCDDPDCWWLCTPACPPLTTCAPTAPHCGDGSCSPLESCRACPGDCGACTQLCGDLHCDAGETCAGDCP